MMKRNKLLPRLLVAMAAVVLANGARTAEEWKDRVIYQILTDRFSQEEVAPTKQCDKLRTFCGGSFQGIIQRLDYIKNLGANAIWISPIVEQTTNGYHGYWARDITAIEPNWGTEQDLHDLVEAAHAKDIWIMVDVVPNHMGYPEGCSDIIECDEEQSVDFSDLFPFNASQYYHDLCQIDWSGEGPDQTEMELCRLANLPDLNQTVPFVRQTLLEWIQDLTTTYNIDGYRVDTVRHIEMPFWGEYQTAAGTFCMGEVWHEEDSTYPAAYQEQLDSITNYPLYRAIKEAFHQQKSFADFAANLQDQRANFKDTSVLTMFIDNHDVERFLNVTQDKALFHNALTYIFYGEGIPILYYGTEQDFAGGHDPENRESLWPHYDEGSGTYNFISGLLTARQRLAVGGSPQEELMVQENVMVFGRVDQQVLVAVTNVGAVGEDVSVTLADLADDAGEGKQYEYVNVMDAQDKIPLVGGALTITLTNGEPRVYERTTTDINAASAVHTGILSTVTAFTLVLTRLFF